MQPDETTNRLLVEIRDLQQQMLNEYSRALTLNREAFAAQQRAIEQQAEAVAMQRKSARLYKMVLLIAGPVLMFLVWRLLDLPI